MSEIVLRRTAEAADMPAVRQLFQDYAAWFDAAFKSDICFQGFAAELAALPGAYAPPRGGIWLAEDGTKTVGIVALKPLPDGSCEMKRLWVAESARGSGLGRRLVEACLAGARDAGYGTMRLETLPGMTGALALYRGFGFHETAPYAENPPPGILFQELAL